VHKRTKKPLTGRTNWPKFLVLLQKEALPCFKCARLIPTGLDPDSRGIGVASVPAQKASGSFLKKRTKKLFTLKRYADRNTYAK
jgi:hypothetical protein